MKDLNGNPFVCVSKHAAFSCLGFSCTWPSDALLSSLSLPSWIAVTPCKGIFVSFFFLHSASLECTFELFSAVHVVEIKLGL